MGPLTLHILTHTGPEALNKLLNTAVDSGITLLGACVGLVGSIDRSDL